MRLKVREYIGEYGARYGVGRRAAEQVDLARSSGMKWTELSLPGPPVPSYNASSSHNRLANPGSDCQGSCVCMVRNTGTGPSGSALDLERYRMAANLEWNVTTNGRCSKIAEPSFTSWSERAQTRQGTSRTKSPIKAPFPASKENKRRRKLLK